MLEDKNHVIVADTRNERVVLLKSDFQLKRVLTQSLDCRPVRLCLSKSTGLMFISYAESSVIDIYQFISSKHYASASTHSLTE
jgi:hypothetical protein